MKSKTVQYGGKSIHIGILNDAKDLTEVQVMIAGITISDLELARDDDKTTEIRIDGERVQVTLLKLKNTPTQLRSLRVYSDKGIFRVTNSNSDFIQHAMQIGADGYVEFGPWLRESGEPDSSVAYSALPVIGKTSLFGSKSTKSEKSFEIKFEPGEQKLNLTKLTEKGIESSYLNVWGEYGIAEAGNHAFGDAGDQTANIYNMDLSAFETEVFNKVMQHMLIIEVELYLSRHFNDVNYFRYVKGDYMKEIKAFVACIQL